MLIIRHAQMELFRALDRAAFEQRLAEHLQGAHPLDAESATAIVAACMAAASRFGLTEEAGLFALADLMAQEGLDFFDDPQRPKALAILSDLALPERARLQRLAGRRPWLAVASSDPVIESD